MKYGFDVFAFVGKKNGKDIYEWKARSPTGGQPYRYGASARKAERMARICPTAAIRLCRSRNRWPTRG